MTLCGGWFMLEPEFTPPPPPPTEETQELPAIPMVQVVEPAPGAGYTLDDLSANEAQISETDYALNVWLQAPSAEADLLASAQVIAARLQAFHIAATIEVNPGDSLRVRSNAPLESILPLLTQVGFFEIADVSTAVPAPSEGTCIYTTAQQAVFPDQPLCALSGILDDTFYPSIISGDVVADARAMPDPHGFGMVQIKLTLTEEAAATFADFTTQHIGGRVAVLVDGQAYLVPVIQERIEGEAVITGDFTMTEAETLAALLRQAPLPQPLSMAGIKTFPE